MQQFGGLIFDPFGFFQRLQNQGLFELGDGTVQAHHLNGYLDGRGVFEIMCLSEFDRQIRHGKLALTF